MEQVGGIPRPLRVFISSTYEDLKPYVHAAEEALRGHVDIDWFKNWSATGRPSVSECRDHVQACDALVVLVGHTYGWVPRREDGGDGRTSITRLEVQWAREKPIPVLPFFIEDPLQAVVESDAESARLHREFVAELQSHLGKPVSSLAGFADAVRQSVLDLARDNLHKRVARPEQVGNRAQGICTHFFDRDEPRRDLHAALTRQDGRGAAIVGRGGLGKSALANWAIDQLRAEGAIEQIVYLPRRDESCVEDFALFMSTMEASGKAKVTYEGSWAALSRNRRRLLEVLMEVYAQQRILLLFDAFEHNLDDTGAIRSETLLAFVNAFVESRHSSKLLMTTRRFPLFPAVEAMALPEIPLEHGLPVADGIALLESQSPGGIRNRTHVEAAIKAVDGIPFAVQRMAFLLRGNRLLEVRSAAVREGTLDAFVELTHSTLSPHAHLTLQARAVFDEPVPAEALNDVLADLLPAQSVEAAIEELGRGSFLFLVDDGGLGMHELDQESSYRSIDREGTVDRRRLHRRAADYYARQCREGDYWFDWSSYDELRPDLKRFHHLVKAGEPLAAAEALSTSKVEFLSYEGHVREIERMFAHLDVGPGATRGMLVKRYARAECLAILGPFDQAIAELEAVIELARDLGDTRAESSASYELASSYRYFGRTDEAVTLLRSVTGRLRETGDHKLRGYYLYGHSLACSYVGLYAEAIRLGEEQVEYGRQSGVSDIVSRGNSSLCLPYYVIGLAEKAAAAAAAACRAFVNTPKEYLVGYNENIQGLSLFELGRLAEAFDAFTRASVSARKTDQRRAEGLINVNKAWVLYESADLAGARATIDDAINTFDALECEPDARVARYLREAFDRATARDRRREATSLWSFVADDYMNPDFIRRLTVAARILSIGDEAPGETRALAQSMVEKTRASHAAMRAELGDIAAEPVVLRLPALD